MFFNIPDDYKELLGEDFFERDDYKNLEHNIKCEYLCKSYKVLPDYDNLFRALELTPVDNVKVVIVAQDPYYKVCYEPNGLSFSSNSKGKLPPSLKNIYKSIGIENKAKTNDLKSWAEQGVLLLNSCLTVVEGYPESHFAQGWEYFTDNIIKKLSNQHKNIVFVLMGEKAGEKDELIDHNKHSVIKAKHPGARIKNVFNGRKVFKEINDQLSSWGKKEIDWKKNIV